MRTSGQWETRAIKWGRWERKWKWKRRRMWETRVKVRKIRKDKQEVEIEEQFGKEENIWERRVKLS